MKKLNDLKDLKIFQISWKLIVCFLLLSSVAQAQVGPDTPIRNAIELQSANARKAANWFSTGLVVGSLIVPCIQDRHWRCVENEALQVGVAVAGAELTKLFVHRERPNKVDKKSFFSEHTIIACVATMRTKYFAFCPAVGYLRVAADWHWSTDTFVAAGAAAGIVFTVHPWWN